MRQVRITISDEAWEQVSLAAVRRHMDRGALIDEILRDPDSTDSHFYVNPRAEDTRLVEVSLVPLTPENIAAGTHPITRIEKERDGHS